MGWITNYWYVILLGLVAAMVLFGFRSKDNKEVNAAGHQDESQKKKEHTGGHSCCH
jgi:hypothetical protein